VRHAVRITFSKTGLMAFISHLDLMRLFARAVRRAGVPVCFTQGFNPHPKISIDRALRLGVESDSLEAVLHLDAAMDPGELKERLGAEFPEGIRVLGVKIEADGTEKGRGQSSSELGVRS